MINLKELMICILTYYKIKVNPAEELPFFPFKLHLIQLYGFLGNVKKIFSFRYIIVIVFLLREEIKRNSNLNQSISTFTFPFPSESVIP